MTFENVVIFSDTAIDCQWSQWGEWSECYQTCKPGEKSHMRTHAILAQFGGNRCEGDERVATQVQSQIIVDKEGRRQ